MTVGQSVKARRWAVAMKLALQGRKAGDTDC